MNSKNIERVFKVSKVYGSAVSSDSQAYVLAYFTSIERARAYMNMRTKVAGYDWDRPETLRIDEVSIKELS